MSANTTSHREFAELDHERPVAEVGPVQTVYVNGVSSVELIGSDNGALRVTFFSDGRARLDGQPVEKVPEIALIISVADYQIARQFIAAKLKALGLGSKFGFDQH